MSEQSKPMSMVVDVETTMNGSEENPSDPFHENNSLVMVGLRPSPENRPFTYEGNGGHCIGTENKTEPVRLLIGHNLHFDLHYLRRFGWLKDGWQKDVTLWDTQLAEYLLTGQEHTTPSLDELTAKYVGAAAMKDSTVTDIFKSGKGADHVPRNLLTKYLEADLNNTHEIFLKQVSLAIDKDMLPLIRSQMDALLATEEMTYNGMHTNLAELSKGLVLNMNTLGFLLNDMKKFLKDNKLEDIITNINSPSQLSILLFGGVVTTVEKKVVGKFKNGKDKIKAVSTKRVVNSILRGYFYDKKGPKNRSGYYSTDDAQLKRVLEHVIRYAPASMGTLQTFLENLLTYRDISKQVNTYWRGLLALRNTTDGCIHHSINHTVTKTGRSSSSRPNLQNITNGDIKKVFDSRWNCGIIIEADYGQLEMIELAIVSGDAQLKHDIEHGIDMHNALYEAMYHKPLDPKNRKQFKRCSFALIYGAGAAGIAEQGGISEAEAKKFITTFYDRYSGVHHWHIQMRQWAQHNRKITGEKTEKGFPRGKAVYCAAPTNRRYVFKEYDAPDFLVKQKVFTSFSPTELKNYPIQGGATGDKVPLAYGLLLRVLKNNPRLANKCLLINTVHDSVLFDCHPDVYEEAVEVIKDVMERMMPQVYEELFKFKLPLKFKVGVSAGPNWLDQKEI